MNNRKLVSLGLAALIVCSSSACTKRQATVGVGVGVGMFLAGAVMLNSSTEQTMGIGLVGFFAGMCGGAAIAGLSLIGGIVGAYHPWTAIKRPNERAPESPVPEGRRCVPVSAMSSSWTCGEGYACTDDFESCEPAVGAPLRQR